MKRLLVALSILLTHCVPLPPASSTQTDGGAGANVIREKSIPIDGDPNGLWWDGTEHVLYIADDDHNRVLKWTDDAGLSAVGALSARCRRSPPIHRGWARSSARRTAPSW